MRYFLFAFGFIFLCISCSKESIQEDSDTQSKFTTTSIDLRNDEDFEAPDDSENDCTVSFFTDWVPYITEAQLNIGIDIMFDLYHPNFSQNTPSISCAGCHAPIVDVWIRHDDNQEYSRVEFIADCEDLDCEFSFEDCVAAGVNLCFTAGLGHFENQEDCYWVLNCQTVDNPTPPHITTNSSGTYMGPTPNDNLWIYEGLGFQHPDAMTCPF